MTAGSEVGHCPSTALKSLERQGHSGTRAVAHYRDCQQRYLTEVRASKFERCMDKVMTEQLPKIKVLSARGLWAAAFPGKAFVGYPRTLETILPALADADTQQRIRNLNLRYVVVLDIKTEGAFPHELDPGLGLHLGLGGLTQLWTSHTWTRILQLYATILDARSAQKSGSLS